MRVVNGSLPQARALGSGIRFINRPPIPTGLHQVLKQHRPVPDWRIHQCRRHCIHGDINRFYAGDGTAGMFMSGFFPIMMFIRRAPPGDVFRRAERTSSDGGRYAAVRRDHRVSDRRNRAAGIPVCLLAPLLYLLHAILDRYQPVRRDAAG